MQKIYQARDEYDEAHYIVEQMEHLKREEYYKYSDFAVLYRMNTQSRVIETVLGREGIPYRVVGGLKFFERKEIKDIIAYLRLIQNENDNLSLKRIINEPKRGIGKTSLDKVEQISEQTGTSMYEIIKDAINYGLNRVYLNSREFIECIENLKNKKDELSDVYGGWEYNSYYVFNSDGTYRWYKSSDNLKDNYYEGKMEILKGDDAIQELGIKYSQVLTVMSNSKGNVNLNDIYCIKLHPTYLISGGVNKTSTLTDEFDMKLLFVYVNDKEAQAYNYATQDTLYLHKK